MIHSITVTNYLGDSLTLTLSRPEESGFIVMSVTGLGPAKANINTTEISTNDGALYNSARVTSRNIVLSLRFLFDPTIEDVRQKSYKFFPIKREVTLVIETDNRRSRITGYVESNEPDIFSEEEGCEISIICPDPYFYDASSDMNTSFSGVEPLFEFPFSNESLTENLLEMSEIVDVPERVILYQGDAEIGVTISIKAIGDAGDITIYNITTEESMMISSSLIETLTGYAIKDKDEIIITTMTGNKSVTLLRDGIRTNILNCIDRNSDWFRLVKGENTFAYEATEGQNNLQMVIENEIAYEGV